MRDTQEKKEKDFRQGLHALVLSQLQPAQIMECAYTGSTWRSWDRNSGPSHVVTSQNVALTTTPPSRPSSMSFVANFTQDFGSSRVYYKEFGFLFLVEF